MKARKLIHLLLGFIAGGLLGYWAGFYRGAYHWPSDSWPHPRGITLAKVLRQRGVTPQSIAYLRFLGDESAFTGGRSATVGTNSDEIRWIWERMIETAEPYVFWESSGWRRVEIYTRTGHQPAVTLAVNTTDATCIAGDNRTFMCHGLEALAMRHLMDTNHVASK